MKFYCLFGLKNNETAEEFLAELNSIYYTLYLPFRVNSNFSNKNKDTTRMIGDLSSTEAGGLSNMRTLIDTDL